MVLATAGEDGRPSSRTVLCKGLDERGVVFYTNYTSAKSHDLRGHPLRLGHLPLVRRSTGRCTCAARSSRSRRGDRRPTGRPARGARSWGRGRRRSRRWCATAASLDDALAGVTQRFADDEEVPVPRHWGGWRIGPEQVEFWQGRTNRMHDRLRFVARRRRPQLDGAPPRPLTSGHRTSDRGGAYRSRGVVVMVER